MKIRDRIVELRRVKASELRPNPRNWRRHPKAQADALRGILAEVGFAGALLARETPEGLQLIDGHLRAETTPSQKVPVLVLDVTEQEARKLLATYDTIGALAERDDEMLRSLVAEAEIGSDALRGLFAADDEAGGSGASGDGDGAAADPDKTPEPRKVAVSHPGDVWILGAHRLLNGDATERESYRALLGDVRPPLLLTDPPYGVAYQDAGASRIQGDLTQAALPVMLACATEVLSDDARLYVFCATDQIAMLDRSFNHWLGMRPRLIVWKKESFVLRHNGYHSQFEMVGFAWKGAGGGLKFWSGDRKQSDVWEISRDALADRVHPTQKPVDLLAIPLRNSSAPGDAVLEPFSGSGATLIACERLERRCFAIELDALFVDVAVRRWQELTGKAATLEASGETFEITAAARTSPAKTEHPRSRRRAAVG